MPKVYYVKDERLIRNSKVLEEYPILTEVFEKYPELDTLELSVLSDEIKDFFKYIYPKVIKEAVHEWDIDEAFGLDILDDKSKIKCQLCNHDIKNVCQIKNKENGNTLKIGTECVKHFEFNSNIDIDNLLEERKQIKRVEILNSEIPDIEKIISEWNIIIEKQNIYIKSSISERYYKIIDEIRELFNEYIEKKNITVIREREIINSIKELINEGLVEREKIINYVESNSNKKLIPTKNIIRYLKSINDVQGLEWIDEDGILKCRTLFRIVDKNFVKSLIPDFNLEMNPKGIIIKDIMHYKNEIGYLVMIKQNTNVKLFCDYKDFIFSYGGIITKEDILKDINQSEIINIGQLRDAESIEYALGQLENNLSSYSIEYDEFFYDYNDVLWKKYKNGKKHYYILTKLDSLKELLKEVSYKIKSYRQDELYEIITNNSATLSNSDAEDLKRNRNR